jgi:hypothetical protein
MGSNKMTARDHLAGSAIAFQCFSIVIALIAIGPLSSPASAEPFDSPSFRKGLWHFVRTLDVMTSSKTRQRVEAREMTRCVDPTHAMKVTFSPLAVGNCVSARPEKTANKYVFSNRCDYMGPVNTVITVHNEESYSELNHLKVGLPRTELVVARRIGDCQDEPAENAGRPQVLSH